MEGESSHINVLAEVQNLNKCKARDPSLQPRLCEIGQFPSSASAVHLTAYIVAYQCVDANYLVFFSFVPGDIDRFRKLTNNS